jgi:hypothetical protein
LDGSNIPFLACNPCNHNGVLVAVSSVEINRIEHQLAAWHLSSLPPKQWWN